MSTLPAVYLGHALPLPVDVPMSQIPTRLTTKLSMVIAPCSLASAKNN